MNSQNDNKPAASRRTFLVRTGVGAAGTLGVLGGTAHAQTAPPNASNKTPGVDYDVVVIGGGFAGVAAARNARAKGYRVLILEARNRLGGRTFSAEFAGHKIEMGGTWIHWTQPYVWAEKERYGLEVVETPDITGAHNPENEEFVVINNKQRKVLVGAQAYPLGVAIEKYFGEARIAWDRPYDAKFAWSEIAKRDSLSALDVLKRMHFGPVEHTAIESYLAAMGHGDPSTISYVDMLRWWSLPGWNFGILNDSVTRYKLKDGTKALIDLMIADGKPDVRLSTPVKKVEDLGGTTVITTTRGEKITAAAVIVALPMNVLPHLEFSPPLDPLVVEAGLETHAGRGTKVYAKVKGHVTKNGKSTALGHAELPLTLAFTYAIEKDHTILLGFGTDSSKLDVTDEQAVQAALRVFYPHAEVESCAGYDWTHDPYSRGTWCTYRPHWFQKYYDHFGKDQGRVLFATGDHGEGWRGFIDGAIGSGIRVVQRLDKLLTP
ncbi:MAG TPA: NAD(P)/FAD-dependent oxidoreductase [Rhodoferax sp.]|nr:NAD(P)/FAD-dependent oxidoreductase [Rhodoferax sp.]HQC86530.1 NAD(P)/FAD-dependent oxidoreductase [Rhodoferax sp.]